MNWFKRKTVEEIPNPRDSKRRRREARFESIQKDVLMTVQFFVFALAVLILLAVA